MNEIKREMAVIHPGELLKSELIKENGLTVSEVAEMLKVSRQAISNILNGSADISTEMALRIATVFGGTPNIWMNLQAKYDLQKTEEKVKQFKLIPYGGWKNSGVQSFELGKDFIIIQFKDGRTYLYNYQTPGKIHVDKMKSLALKGESLANYINKNIRDNYAHKLNNNSVKVANKKGISTKAVKERYLD